MDPLPDKEIIMSMLRYLATGANGRLGQLAIAGLAHRVGKTLSGAAGISPSSISARPMPTNQVAIRQAR
jgi:hypothetical protein